MNFMPLWKRRRKRKADIPISQETIIHSAQEVSKEKLQKGDVFHGASNENLPVVTSRTLQQMRSIMPATNISTNSMDSVNDTSPTNKTSFIIILRRSQDARWAFLCMSALLLLLMVLVLYSNMWKHKHQWEGFKNLRNMAMDTTKCPERESHIFLNMKELVASKWEHIKHQVKKFKEKKKQRENKQRFHKLSYHENLSETEILMGDSASDGDYSHIH